MKKKFTMAVALTAAVLVLGGLTATALAASVYDSPAQALAALTGKTVDEVVAQKVSGGGTYGALANEAGVLDDFHAQMLLMRQDLLARRVEEGRLTQEQADTMIAAMADRDCDGAGNGACALGDKQGIGFGRGQGNGACDGTGMGQGNGQRNGTGLRKGSCVVGG